MKYLAYMFLGQKNWNYTQALDRNCHTFKCTAGLRVLKSNRRKRNKKSICRIYVQKRKAKRPLIAHSPHASINIEILEREREKKKRREEERKGEGSRSHSRGLG